MRLAYASGERSRPSVSDARAISPGVLRLVAPLPPATKSPTSASRPRSPSFNAPQTVVVTPLECQSKPSKQPNAWNQYGSERRPRSADGGAGARPPCRGRSAVPVRRIPHILLAQLQVLVGRRVREERDEPEPRLLHARPHAVEERELPQRGEHHTLVGEALD